MGAPFNLAITHSTGYSAKWACRSSHRRPEPASRGRSDVPPDADHPKAHAFLRRVLRRRPEKTMRVLNSVHPLSRYCISPPEFFFFQTALATCLSRTVWVCGVSATTLPLTLSLLIASGCEVLTLANRRTSWRTARKLFLRVASRRIYHVAVRLFFS